MKLRTINTFLGWFYLRLVVMLDDNDPNGATSFHLRRGKVKLIEGRIEKVHTADGSIVRQWVQDPPRTENRKR